MVDRVGAIPPIRAHRSTSCMGAALLLFATGWSVGPVAAVAAEEARADPGKWQFEVTPYFFGAGLEGTTGVAGVTADIDMGVGDLLDRLDSAFMATVEARKGPLSLLVDGMYVHLKGEQTRAWQGPGGIGTATGDLSADLTDQVYTLAVGRRVVDQGSKADLIVGARYTRLDSHLDLLTTTGGLLPGGTNSVSDKQSWWDPIFGFRLIVPLAEHWSAVGYADLGGFGIGSDVTAQALVGINWEITKRFVAKLGYRTLFQDYDDDGFVWEMAMHGFYAGVGIRF